MFCLIHQAFHSFQITYSWPSNRAGATSASDTAWTSDPCQVHDSSSSCRWWLFCCTILCTNSISRNSLGWLLIGRFDSIVYVWVVSTSWSLATWPFWGRFSNSIHEISSNPCKTRVPSWWLSLLSFHLLQIACVKSRLWTTKTTPCSLFACIGSLTASYDFTWQEFLYPWHLYFDVLCWIVLVKNKTG